MKPIRWPTFCLNLAALLVAAFFAVPACAGAASSFTFFKGTQYPLTVHYIDSGKPGPTVMVQGGIQGDEVSGYLTAQLLTRSKLKKGRLIIVPRANVPTVMARKRQINVDLNRRFDKDYNQYYEDRLARVIRFIIAQSDAFVHLHEGSGFYDPVWVDKLRNPRRYGQSIIIDTPVFQDRINLAQVATSVLAQLNHTIVPAYQFKLFNTNTFASNTSHPEQRKSLTYHALNEAGIPALAIEVSKNIRQLGWKVMKQLKATALVLEQYGTPVELPDVTERDIDRYALGGAPVMINGKPLSPGQNMTVSLPPGGRIEARPAGATDARFNAVSGVFSSDRPGINLLDAPRLALSRFSRLEVQADGHRVGRVDVRWEGSWKEQSRDSTLIACWLNKELLFIPDGGELVAVAGDQLVLEGSWGGAPQGGEDIINFKGFVSRPGKNDGQDAGHEIILDPDAFMARYVDRTAEGETVCRVVRETPGSHRAEVSIRIIPRSVDAVRLEGPSGSVFVPWSSNGAFSIPAGTYRVVDVWSNGSRDKLLVQADSAVLDWGDTFEVGEGEVVPFTLRQATTFKPVGTMHFVCSD